MKVIYNDITKRIERWRFYSRFPTILGWVGRDRSDLYVDGNNLVWQFVSSQPYPASHHLD